MVDQSAALRKDWEFEFCTVFTTVCKPFLCFTGFPPQSKRTHSRTLASGPGFPHARGCTGHTKKMLMGVWACQQKSSSAPALCPILNEHYIYIVPSKTPKALHRTNREALQPPISAAPTWSSQSAHHAITMVLKGQERIQQLDIGNG